MPTELKKEKTDNFLSFLSLGRFFKKEIAPNPFKQFEDKAQLFLETDNYEAFVEMLSQGYTPTKAQANNLSKLISKTASSDISDYGAEEKFMRLEKLIGKGLQLSAEQAFQFFTHPHGIFAFNEDFFAETKSGKEKKLKVDDSFDEAVELPNLTKELRKNFTTSNFSDIAASSFKQDLYFRHKKVYAYKIYDILEKYRLILKNTPEMIFKDVSFDEFMQMSKRVNSESSYNQDKDLWKSVTDKLYSGDIKNIIKDTRNQYAGQFVERLTLERIKTAPHSIKELPPLALEVVEYIEDLYGKIKSNKDLQVEDSHKVELLLEKRVPEILSKYLNVDISYRKTLFDMNGKSAEELMMDSLNDIKISFDDVFERLNKDKLHSLTTLNAYTKAIRPR